MCKYGIEDNTQIIEEFLRDITSEKLRVNVKCSLKNFFGNEATNHGWDWKWEENILSITTEDLFRYNRYVNAYKEWSFKTKITKFGHVKRLVKYVLKAYESKFTDRERIYDRLRADLNEKDYYKWANFSEHKQPETAYKRYFMTKDQISKILEYLNEHKPIYYLMFRLLAESGLRKGELLSINLERNVEGEIIPLKQDLEKRMIRVKGKKGLLKYPITEELKNQLLTYLEERKNYEREDKEGKPFFLNQQYKRFGDGALNSMLMGTIKKDGSIKRRGILRILGITEHITPQTFRRSLNELRASKGCSDKWLAILLNHKIQSNSERSGTNIQYYQDRNFPKVLENFDKYYPYGDLFSELNYY